jgi:hypothetical protein
LSDTDFTNAPLRAAGNQIGALNSPWLAFLPQIANLRDRAEAHN